MSPLNADQLGETLPQTFSISVIMQQTPSENPWLEFQWEAVGILAGEIGAATEPKSEKVILSEHGMTQYIYSGFSLTLHIDECESYYHNLMSPTPWAYIVATADESDRPIPVLVSLSFDEAHAYLEGDEHLFSVPVPPEIYQWSEAFVLAHYVPVKRTKRKRQDWRRQAQGHKA